MMIIPTPAARQPEISPVEWAGDPQQCPRGLGSLPAPACRLA
ncbi:hypothetical protein ACFQT0_27350 [Hymenobacter humi]|uniref:Uncharacterized protein n=1 Tax=Hymenobacter humi TaxID=1411620 RepID=A0ABW2UB12_9BACT